MRIVHWFIYDGKNLPNQRFEVHPWSIPTHSGLFVFCRQLQWGLDNIFTKVVSQGVNDRPNTISYCVSDRDSLSQQTALYIINMAPLAATWESLFLNLPGYGYDLPVHVPKRNALTLLFNTVDGQNPASI